MKSFEPEFALEILVNIRENFPKPLLEYWGEDVVKNPLLWFDAAQKKAKNIGAAYISVYFNIDDDFLKIEDCLKLFCNIQKKAELPLIIRGSGQKNFDAGFLPKIIKKVDKPCIIAFAQDLNYEPIVKSILESPLKDDIRLVHLISVQLFQLLKRRDNPPHGTAHAGNRPAGFHTIYPRTAFEHDVL